MNTTTYVWDTAASLPVIVQETTNGATTSYVYGLDMLSATDNSSVTTYFLQDGLGSTTGLTDDDGAVTDTYTYDTFGATKSHTGSSANAWKFTGELNDSTVGGSPYYLRARYYDPALGRFLSRDPLWGATGSPQSQNRYPYVLNNPALLVDPSGLFCLGPFCTPQVPLPPIPVSPIQRIVEKARDVGGCITNLWQCQKRMTEERIVAPLLAMSGHYDMASCMHGHGIEWCLADKAAREGAKRLVGEKSYLDLNLTGGIWGVVGTGGVQMSWQEGLHPYLGGGSGTPGLSASAMVAPNQSIQEGLACSAQGSAPIYGVAGIAGQTGVSDLGGSNMSAFGEVGPFIGTPGAG